MSSPPAPSFSASYDTTTKIVTAVCAALFLGIAGLMQSVLVGILGTLVLVGGYAWSPRRYSLEDRAIRIHRLAGDVIFPLEDLREARKVFAADLSGCIRLFGSGGMFGYYGLFRTSKLGKCTWYVTNRDNTVVLMTAVKTALFSPDDVDAFLAAVGAAVPVPRSPQPRLTSAPSIWSLVGKMAAVAVMLGVAGVVALAITYAPGPPAYTMTRTALTIDDRFYPVTLQSREVDLERARVIDLDRDTGWRPTIRTNGFANGHYRSGWFKVANGQKVRLYSAGSRRLILLPPKGDAVPVLLEVADPESFLRELRNPSPERE